MSQTTINQRLNFLLNTLGMKAGPFSRALGLSETTIRNYIDRNSKPSSEVLEKIVNTFKQVNLVWLVTGVGEHFLPESYEVTQSTVGNQNNVLGVSHGTTYQNNGNAKPHIDSFTQRISTGTGTVSCEEKLKSAEQLIQVLQSQLQDKERIIQLLDKPNK
jgi:predicted transcriptional regulator